MSDSELLNSHTIETYKSIVQYGLLSVRYILLSNGAALVAILAYIGNISSNKLNIPNLEMPMNVFVLGVFCGGCLIFTSYYTQFLIFNENRKRVVKGDHSMWLKFSIFFGIAGLLCFLVGSFWSAKILFS